MLTVQLPVFFYSNPSKEKYKVRNELNRLFFCNPMNNFLFKTMIIFTNKNLFRSYRRIDKCVRNHAFRHFHVGIV